MVTLSLLLLLQVMLSVKFLEAQGLRLHTWRERGLALR